MTSLRRLTFPRGLRAARAAGLLVAACLLLSPSRGGLKARAQSATATLAGTLTDELGAVVPGARVTVLNRATALRRHAVTDGEGYFVVPFLPPGRYAVTAEREGFSTIQVRDVALNVNDERVLRIKLKVGEFGETVEVLDEVAGVEARTSVGAVVERQSIADLPLNGRSFQSLFELAPGTVLTKTTFNEQGQFSVNGQRANANYFTVDGVSANIGVSAGGAPGQAAGGSLPTLTVLGGTNNLVSLEALEEFRIQTSSYAPEFGRTPGAQVSLVTRSGTNELHGAAFDYFRHDALDASDFFVNSRGLRKSKLRQHDFGGVLGGPLLRERAFFFASYEGLRLRQPQVALSEVPSLQTRAAAPAPLRPFLEAFPLPTGRDDGRVFAPFAASYSDPSRFDAAGLRLDWAAGPRLALFARLNHAPSETAQRGSVSVPGFGAQSLNTLNRTRLDTTTLTAAALYAFTPRVTGDLRANFSRARGATSLSLDDFGGARPPAPPLLSPASASPEGAGFRLSLRGGVNANYGVGPVVRNSQRQANVVGTLSVSGGAHHVRVGADLRRLAPTYAPPRYAQAAVFGDGTDAGALASVAGATAAEVRVAAEAEAREPVFTNFSAFVQDTWRAAPRLSFTYGARWEVNPPPRERRGQAPFVVRFLDFDSPDAIIQSAGTRPLELAPRGTPLWATTYGNLAPRFGLAYQPFAERRTVVRAGAGLFYDLGNGQAGQAFGGVFPFRKEKVLAGVPFPLGGAAAEPPPLDLEPPYGPLQTFDPELKLPYSFQWNLSVEQPLGAGQTLTAAYVGALGRRLLRETALLDPTPRFTLVRVVSNTASSRYHSLQLNFQRRLARGIQARAGYTFSRSVDNDSDDSSSNLFRSVAAGDERGPSNFDVRHSLAAALSYDLPSGRAPRAARAVLGGWSLDAILRARTGTPFNVLSRTGAVFGDLVEVRRPNLLEGVPVWLEDSAAPGGRRLNPAAFALPPGTRQGSLGRNSLRGFGFAQLDLGLRRQFAPAEGWKLQLRAEFFNALNRPNFGDPVSDLGSSLFGYATETLSRALGTGGVNGGLSPLYQVGGPRSVQLSLKLLF